MESAPDKALRIVLGLNTAFFAVEAVGGLWTNSLALLSDAAHMLGDIGAMGVALAARRMAARPGDKSYTFGLSRLSVVAGVIHVAALFVTAIWIASGAIQRFDEPVSVPADWVFGIALLGLLANLVSALILRRFASDSVNLKGAYLNLLGDSAASIAVVVSAVLMWLYGWMFLDAVMGLCIVVFIGFSTWPLVCRVGQMILQKAPEGVDVEQIRLWILERPGVAAVRDLHIWELAHGMFVLTAVVESDNEESLAEATRRADQLKENLRDHFDVIHSTVEWRDPSIEYREFTEHIP
jgi:cobalt-zinc-cadmium efflux system protein